MQRCYGGDLDQYAHASSGDIWLESQNEDIRHDIQLSFLGESQDGSAREVFDQRSSQYISCNVIIMSFANIVVEDGNFDWITDDELEDHKLCIHKDYKIKQDVLSCSTTTLPKSSNAMTREPTAPCG